MAKEDGRRATSTKASATKTKKSESEVTEIKVKTKKTGAAKSTQTKSVAKTGVSSRAGAKTTKSTGTKTTKKVLNVIEVNDVKKPSGAKSTKVNSSAKKALVDYGIADMPVAKKTAKSKSAIDGVVKSVEALTAEYEDDIDRVAEGLSGDKKSPQKQKTPKGKKPGKKKAIIITLLVVLVAALGGGIYWLKNHKEVTYCTVSFESNGGSKVEDIDMVCGEKLEEPESPTKEGFSFREWVYRGKAFDFNKSTVDSDIILVAKWDALDDTEVVTVHFDVAGGSEVEDIEIAKGTAIIAPFAPTRNGYTFKGWYLNGAEYEFGSAVEEDITLVAQWEPNGETERPVTNTGSSNSSSTNSSQTQPSVDNNPAQDNTSSGTGGNQTGGNSGGNGYDGNEPEIPGTGGESGDKGEGGGKPGEGGDKGDGGEKPGEGGGGGDDSTGGDSKS